jgi:hypothetical protein
LIEANAASTVRSEITEEHPYRCQDHPDGVVPVVSIPLGQKVSKASSRVYLWIVSEKADEVGHIELIR